MLSRLFFLLLFPAFLSASLPGKINFYNGSLNKAKEKAAAEGKLYFVQFTANWCEPCHWMDEVTYKDPQLIAYINENYVPVKVDSPCLSNLFPKRWPKTRTLWKSPFWMNSAPRHGKSRGSRGEVISQIAYSSEDASLVSNGKT